MRYVLVSEGKSDKMLMQPIDWLLAQHCKFEYSGYWADPSSMDDRSRNLEVRMREVKKFYPSDVAFVHRDTDTFTIADRSREIIEGVTDSAFDTPYVCIIPKRMTEAWFLFDHTAIRRAADKPKSNTSLHLPNANESQRRADPKAILESALVTASDLSGRKLDQFKSEISSRKLLVSRLISDYSPLRAHESFKLFESDLLELIRTNNW